MPLKFLGQDDGRLPRIDRYELIAEIASGGMASVYLARVVGMGGFERLFAIKRLHPHLGTDEEFVRMFLDEARIVAGIRHPHVVPVLEVGASEHGYYLVMEYIEGDTFATLLSRGKAKGTPMPPPVAVRVILDMLSGLHAAHEHVDANGNPIGLVHRDVSPQNILVDVNGVSRIADFGVAHATSRLGSTRSGQLKGKVAYMAPEQAQGEVVTPRSDVFAAAIVLWEALAQRRLFLADDEVATLNRLIFEPIPLLRTVNPALPAAIETVLDRALQRDPKKRFASALDFADELQSTARACRLLGTPSDVKSYLLSLIGVGIEREQASVRSFLASVPNEPSSLPLISSPSSLPTNPSKITLSNVANNLSTSQPSSLTEVVSTEPVSTNTPTPRRFWPFVMLATVLIVAVAGLVISQVRPEPTSDLGDKEKQMGASPVVSLALPVGTPTEEARQQDAAVDALADSVNSAEIPLTSTSSLPLSTTTKKHGRTPATTSSTSSSKAASTATSTPAVVDDMKRNPYR